MHVALSVKQLCDIRECLYPDGEKYPSYSWMKIWVALGNDGWVADLFVYQPYDMY